MRVELIKHTAEEPLSARLRVYLFLLVFLSPMDYFRPTALLFREFGARPAIPIMVLGSLVIFSKRWKFLFFHAPAYWVQIVRGFLLIGICGTVAYVFNFGFGISYTDGARNPTAQFFAQGALFALVPFVLFTHADLLRRDAVIDYMVKMVPIALSIHLLIVGLQAIDLLNSANFPLSAFRPPDTGLKHSSGLMTEPSYIGALSGIYGLVCLLVRRTGDKGLLKWVIALAGVVVSLLIGAKTIVPVIAAATVGYAWARRLKLTDVRVIFGILCVLGLATYNVLAYSALDVRDNLSSAMRIGSASLAWNVAKAGYGLLGIGFGQFHFLYDEKFAPWYLAYSPEAMLAFSHNAINRASTYNMFLRYLVETGIIGFSILIWIIASLLRNGRTDSDRCRFGVILLCGSIGFLFTQDPFFLPSFVLGAAVLMGSSKSTQTQEAEC